MFKLTLLLLLLSSFLFFYPKDEEGKMDLCLISEEATTHDCYIRCQGFGNHWRGCCIPPVNVQGLPADVGICACCQRDYSQNRDFCSVLRQGECPRLYDLSVCFYIEGNRKQYCDHDRYTESESREPEEDHVAQGSNYSIKSSGYFRFRR